MLVYRFAPKKIELDGLEDYLKSKRVSLDNVSFNRYIQKKIATISSQIQMRKLKGLRDNEELQKVLNIFSTFIKS